MSGFQGSPAGIHLDGACLAGCDVDKVSPGACVKPALSRDAGAPCEDEADPNP